MSCNGEICIEWKLGCSAVMVKAEAELKLVRAVVMFA
jgi:hypothetical protein